MLDRSVPEQFLTILPEELRPCCGSSSPRAGSRPRLCWRVWRGTWMSRESRWDRMELSSGRGIGLWSAGWRWGIYLALKEWTAFSVF